MASDNSTNSNGTLNMNIALHADSGNASASKSLQGSYTRNDGASHIDSVAAQVNVDNSNCGHIDSSVNYTETYNNYSDGFYAEGSVWADWADHSEWSDHSDSEEGGSSTSHTDWDDVDTAEDFYSKYVEHSDSLPLHFTDVNIIDYMGTTNTDDRTYGEYIIRLYLDDDEDYIYQLFNETEYSIDSNDNGSMVLKHIKNKILNGDDR